MCGIFGFSFKQGRLSSARRAVLATNLARFNDMRGGHSWGIVGLTGDNVHVQRGLGALSESAYELCDFNTLFAHTRYATNGDVTVKNAHPFRIGHIIGAHNGMIFNHEQLAQRYHRNFEVDSQHIFAHINEERSFKELIGYGAIEWMRDGSRAINLCKLLGGELSVYGIGDENNTDGIVWSSDFRHLQRALSCAGLQNVFRYEVRRHKVYNVINGSFRVDQANRKFKLGSPPKMITEDEEDMAIAEEELRMSNDGASGDRNVIRLAARRPFTYDLYRRSYHGTRTEI